MTREESIKNKFLYTFTLYFYTDQSRAHFSAITDKKYINSKDNLEGVETLFKTHSIFLLAPYNSSEAATTVVIQS